MDEDDLVLIILGRPFLATACAVIDVHKGKLSLRVGSETVIFNIGKYMKSKYSRDDYLYCVDHTAKLIREKWVDTVDHDATRMESSENRLKPSMIEPPKLELKELSEHLDSFDHCLKNLEKMLKRCEETNLVLNWEKCHFMVKEGIILGHKVSKSGIEVDKAKIESISKLPYPTNVKAIRSFLGHAGFYRRFIKDYSQIARLMTLLLVRDAPFNFSEECIQAFDKLELTHAPIMIKPDWSLPFEIMCDANDYAIGAGVENLAPDHLSRLESLDLRMLIRAEIRGLFLEEKLMIISDKNNEPCNALTKSHEGVSPEMKPPKFFDNVIASRREGITGLPQHQGKSLRPDSTGLIFFMMHENSFKLATRVNEPRTSSQGMRHLIIKLKSRWYGPFTVSKDMKNGAIELCDEDGNEFIVNKQRVKPYQKDVLDFDGSDDINLKDEGGVT
ncbi:hypothetical protein Tco_1189368 [Tanacetum coccineum]